MINLDESNLIGKGGERECYIHPTDKSKIIKVEYAHNKVKSNDQNSLDIYYYKHIKNVEGIFDHIPRIYNKLETNKGIGLVFDSISDYTGEISKTFEQVVKSRTLDTAIEEKCLEQLHQYILKNNIIFYDAVLSNILCQEFEKGKFKLVIVDGLGGRKVGPKLWIRINYNYFKKHIIDKKWSKLINNYNLLKNEK